MKRTIITLAACGSLLATATPAEAAPKDPARALKAQLKSGHGVRFTETTTIATPSGGDRTKIQDRKGTLQFSAKGIAASDITTTRVGAPRERVVTVGRTSYVSGGILSEQLPPGASWNKTGYMPGGAGGFHGQVINPAEPKTLAMLVKKGKPSRSTITGKITFKDLAKVSTWFDASVPLRMHNDTTVSYTLTLTSAGLVSRVKSSYAATGVIDANGRDGKVITIDSRFTGWGAKVSIKAPDPGSVADLND
ncbi:hypothetical protein [Nonomuraea aridisoli]|uniref:LppX_LprAFG lipoprotein n=1 Tax=Nonomuraea aridisoli TaxID=2070368 RepID=A0A2W2DZ14_9ACTN|nr:hypothetical protein [Nonomuraea aridisoli]PZG06400.1 hypothetical protein C1J01_42475 [Nonomuraea aridisoli]